MSQTLLINSIGFAYRNIVKPLYFTQDPEKVHHSVTSFGEKMGEIPLVRNLSSWTFAGSHPSIEQTVDGIHFRAPIGLAAGFDYEARLTHILPAMGFGFHTIGTITNMPYEGNPTPRLGRLPKSKSLMVNKGFKNDGAKATIKKLEKKQFSIPLGVSIGRTNSRKLTTQKESVKDIIHAFTLFEQSSMKHSYYELNISCPNLYGDITFYPPRNLHELLSEVEKLHIKRPVYIKMPIEKSDGEVLDMMECISPFSVRGVIFGNLQKDRNNPTLHQDEVAAFPKGNFSGKPTYERSNELISLAYRTYGNRFTIIGCGGIFSAEDAYEKIKRGATLLQLITGLIYMGPQLVSQINTKLPKLLKRDGFSHISDACGVSIKQNTQAG